jgi:hypothetical protein
MFNVPLYGRMGNIYMVAELVPRPKKECLASLCSPPLWYGFLGRPKLLVEMVHKLLIYNTPQEKVTGYEIRRSRGPELKRQVLFPDVTYPSLR